MKLSHQLLIILTASVQFCDAQLYLPFGNELNLHTNTNYLYDETGVYFTTGQNKVSDYKWTKNFSDSLDPRWDFQACMNGDCKVGLPETGPFITAFGINDTTGYIKFHVNTSGLTGASRLSYMVSHKTNAMDTATLQFRFIYKNTTGIKGVNVSSDFMVYPNPVSHQLTVQNSGNHHGELHLVNAVGKEIKQFGLTGESIQSIDLDHLASGLYFLVIQSGDLKTIKKIRISN